MAAPSNTPRYSDDLVRQFSTRPIPQETVASCTSLGDQRLRTLARRIVEDDATHEKRCKLLQEKENYRVYEVLDEDATRVTMKGVLLLQNASCDQVLELLTTPTLYPDLFGSLYVDSAILQAPSSSSSEALGTTAIHWLMLRGLSAHVPHRDFLFSRYHKTFASENPQCSSWGASVWESVDIPHCHPIIPPAVSKRCRFTHCGLVVESSDHGDATRITFFVSASSDTPQDQQTDRQWLLKVAACVRFLPSALVNHRIRLHRLVDKRDWIDHDLCGICTQSFSKVFRRQHHCRLCGMAVCSKCSTLRDTNAVRVCLSCINGQDTSTLWGSIRMARKKLDSTGSGRNLTASITSLRDPSISSGYSLSGEFSSYRSRGSALDEYLDIDRTKCSVGSLSFSSTSSNMSGDDDDIVTNSSFDYPLTYAKGNAWPDAPVPASEQQRLQRIKTLNLSQQYAKDNLKELLDFARTSISCGVAAVAIVSVSKILLVTAVGLAGDQLPRAVGFEAHALMTTKPLVVLDTQKDERFAMNPLVSSLNIRFYIGLPLVTHEGIVIGALSLGDTTARAKVNGSDLRALQRIASRIVGKMDTGVVDETAAAVSGMLLI